MVDALTDGQVRVQVVATTHSPWLTASLEPLFDPARDALWTLDLVRNGADTTVQLTPDAFELRGDVSSWLTSHVFDMPSARSLEAERAVRVASRLLNEPAPAVSELEAAYSGLRQTLGDMDPFWTRWLYLARKKGLQK